MQKFRLRPKKTHLSPLHPIFNPSIRPPRHSNFLSLPILIITFLSFLTSIVSADTLKTVGAYPCSENDSSIIHVSNFTFIFDRYTNNVTYYVEGTSTETVSIIAYIQIFAYGNRLLNERVNLCDEKISELCPISEGNIITSGVHNVPSNYTEAISTVAYKVPDIEGTVTIQLYNASNPSQNIGCFSSSISNGVSTDIAAVKFLTIGLAAAALVISGVSSAANSASSSAGTTLPHIPVTGAEGHTVAGGANAAAPTSGPGTNIASGGFHAPGFVEFFSVLQSIAISGMYSVNYPKAYRNFTQNMGWSTGAITWAGMQNSIDDFRSRTGGNLTASNYTRLQETTLIFGNQTNVDMTTESLLSNTTDSSNATETTRRLVKKWLDDAGVSISTDLFNRATANITTASDSTNSSSSSNTTISTSSQSEKKYVSIVTGIKSYMESLSIPDTNTFMTLLIWWAIIVAICIASILSFKLFLEIWCLRTKHPSRFEGFRQRYWIFLGSTLVRITTLLYGVWVLYCLYQFKIGDSWGTKLLAGLTLGIFSLILLLYAARICFLAHRARRETNGLEFLFLHKPWIRKYGLFYDQFKVKFWWSFIPVFLASFGRNAFLALGYGNGLVQIIGQLVIDVLLCAFFAIALPFNTKMGNGINLSIQIVRVISLVFLLIFTVQLDINRIAVTGVGMALIVIQAVLAIVLALLIFTNAIMGLINMTCGNKLRKRRERKKMEKMEKKRLKAEQSSRNLLKYDNRAEKLSAEYSSYASSEPSNTTPQSPKGFITAGEANQPPGTVPTPPVDSTSKALISITETPVSNPCDQDDASNDRGFSFVHDLESQNNNVPVTATATATASSSSMVLPSEMDSKNEKIGGWKRGLLMLGSVGLSSKRKNLQKNNQDVDSENLSRLSATSQNSKVFKSYHNTDPVIGSSSRSSESDNYNDHSNLSGSEGTGDLMNNVKQRSVNPKTVRASLSGAPASTVTPQQASFGDENNVTIDSASFANRNSYRSSFSGSGLESIPQHSTTNRSNYSRPFSAVSSPSSSLPSSSSQLQNLGNAPVSHGNKNSAGSFVSDTHNNLINSNAEENQYALLRDPFADSAQYEDDDFPFTKQISQPNQGVLKHTDSSISFSQPSETSGRIANPSTNKADEIPGHVERQMFQEIDDLILPKASKNVCNSYKCYWNV
ncbi:uncharacterized protein SAPINGB_P001513 [Magnusiomyces paraingens]|uniref:ML-like domain-containing protein n=1 Tax=Magnusiomyces paraingens TaxID=2606893 RepID=A0A5E8BC88_9ASCO|nr:uncharacterized protein SAPINGB_P001513 [Saprochaete ingens]VVT47039.1 unnamed protein product [Saprochaete ingens]